MEPSARFAAAAPSRVSVGSGGGDAIGVSFSVNRPLLSDVLEATRARTAVAAGVTCDCDCEEAEGAASAVLAAAGEAAGAGADAAGAGGGPLASTSDS